MVRCLVSGWWKELKVFAMEDATSEKRVTLLVVLVVSCGQTSVDHVDVEST